MTNEELTVKVLDKLVWDYDEVLNKGHYSSVSDVLAGDVIYNLLVEGTTTKAAKVLNIGVQTFNRILEKSFTPIFGSLNGGNETWKWKLLTFIEYKSCSSCSSILPFADFDTDNSTSTKKHHYCKLCRKGINNTSYSKPETKQSHKLSYERNYSSILERNTRYKIERTQRVPAWSETDSIKEFYNNCPEGYHVDHILPLKGELVSGLHVLGNLQYLPAEDNIRKGNRIDLEYINNTSVAEWYTQEA